MVLPADSFRQIPSAVVSQALSSLTNFAFSFYLLRTLTPEDFGIFSIGFAVMIFLAGFPQGFFTLQYVVLSHSESDRQFPAQVYTLLTIASLIFALGCGLVALVIEPMTGLGLFTVSVSLASVGFAVKEFHIRHAFNTGFGIRALAINAAMGAALAVLLSALWLSRRVPQVDEALLCYAAAVAATALVGHFISGLSLQGHSIRTLRRVFARIRAGGNWTLATNVIYTLRGQAHTLVVAAMLGPIALAKVNAARLFLAPPILLLPALSSVILPRFARDFASGESGSLCRSQRRHGLILVAITGAYSAILITLWPHFETGMPGEEYQGLIALLGVWGVYACALVFRSMAEWGAQAGGGFAAITRASIISAFLAVTAAWALTGILGPSGAVLAMAAAEIIMGGVIWTTSSRRR